MPIKVIGKLEDGIQTVDKAGRFWLVFFGVVALILSFAESRRQYDIYLQDEPYTTTVTFKKSSSNYITNSFEEVETKEEIETNISFGIVSVLTLLNAGIFCLVFAIFPNKKDKKRLKMFLLGNFMVSVGAIWLNLIFQGQKFPLWLVAISSGSVLFGLVFWVRAIRMN